MYTKMKVVDNDRIEVHYNDKEEEEEDISDDGEFWPSYHMVYAQIRIHSRK